MINIDIKDRVLRAALDALAEEYGLSDEKLRDEFINRTMSSLYSDLKEIMRQWLTGKRK